MATPISPSVQDALQTLDARVELNLLEVLAKSYGEGFVKAVEGMEAKPQIKKDDSRLLKEDVARMTRPIQDYNKALAGKVDEIVRDSFAAGKDDMEVARILRARIPEILNNEPITIQRPGKRPVSFTADDYADMVANVVPYAVRNEGYIRGLKEAGADGWQSVAVGDERMCPMCGEKHGQVYGWDDPKPPYHVSCRCRPVAYFRKKTKEEMAESERIKAWAEEKPWESKSTGQSEFEPLNSDTYDDLKDSQIRVAKDLLKEEKKAIKSEYTLNSSYINGYLANDPEFISLSDDFKAKVAADAKNAVAAIEKFRLTEDTTVWRGIKKDIEAAMPPEALEVGKVFKNETILSTSFKSEDKALGYAKWTYLEGEKPLLAEVRLPKDTKALLTDVLIDPKAKYSYSSESEILVAPTSFRVVGFEETETARKVIWEAIIDGKPLPLVEPNVENVAEALIDDIIPKKMAYPGSKIERPKLERKTIDLHNSPVIQKATVDEIAYMNGASSSGVIEKGDSKLKALAEEIGFSDMPTIVSESELDKIVAEGHRELWRGLNQNKPGEFTNLFRSGEYFAGEGIYGNGIYTGTGEGARNLAALYAPGEHGAVMRMAIDKDAKVITVTELKEKLDAELKSLKFDRSSEEAWAASKVKKEFMQDPGRAAVVWGYDAIDVENGQFIVLNRKAIYVQATDYTREDRSKW